MTQVERDLIVLGAIGHMLKEEEKKLLDIIPEMECKKLTELAETTDAFKTDEATNDAIFELVKECYGRLKENFE